LAADKGHLQTVQDILKLGANPHIEGKHKIDAFYMATKRGHLEVVNFFFEKGLVKDVNKAYETNEQTALLAACKHGHHLVAKVLIE